MKKKAKIINVIILIIVTVILAGAIVIKIVIPKLIETGKIEYQNKNYKEVVEVIDNQLKDIDMDKVIEKSDLILEKNILELQNSVSNGEITYKDITALYLYRIKKFDQTKEGYNSIISINPKAIEQANKCDENENTEKNLLYGIPVTLKDNINTNFLPTTGGSVALKEFVPKTNAEIVDNLLNDGAIILGKNNMSQFANFMSIKMPSGYTDLKGQNLNPYGKLNITTYGSSSGSATSVTANFSAVSIGTETTGSIIAPASIQGVVGFKPSISKIESNGIIPLAPSLDVAGPITRNVLDAAITYNSISTDKINLEALEKNYAEGMKIIMLKEDKNTILGKEIIKQLEKMNCNITFKESNLDKLNNFDILVKEFKESLNSYLIEFDAPYKSLDEIVEFNSRDLPNRAKYGQDLLEMSNAGNKLEKSEIENRIKSAKITLDKFIGDADAFIFADNEGAILSCMAGAPEVTIPLCINEDGMPHGLTIVTKTNMDEKAIKIAFSLEQNINKRIAPVIK